LNYQTYSTTKSGKRKTDKLRSVSEQSREFVESVLKKKRKATMGRIGRKRRFLSLE